MSLTGACTAPVPGTGDAKQSVYDTASWGIMFIPGALGHLFTIPQCPKAETPMGPEETHLLLA